MAKGVFRDQLRAEGGSEVVAWQRKSYILNLPVLYITLVGSC